jgi:hypothetical protein
MKNEKQIAIAGRSHPGDAPSNPLDTTFGIPRPRPGHGTPEQPHGPPQLPRWLTVEQIRKMQRCRRETVVDAMLSGDLPFEQRGRIRYARLTDVIAWEERRLRPDAQPIRGIVHPDLQEFA